MKWNNWIGFLLIGIMLGCSELEQPSIIDLRDGWEFRQVGSEEWHAASVPGVVHTDLLAHQLIPDPWKGTNESKVQWIEKEQWEYRKTFNLSRSQVTRNVLDLVFEGLDTYAEVKVNGTKVLSADNMFRTTRVPVKEQVKEGSNELTVTFQSPIEVNAPKLEALRYELPAGSETVDKKVSPFTRKAAYHFGWDWGPRLVTSGIWRPVYIESYDIARLADVQIIQNDLTDEVAKLEAVMTIEAFDKKEVKLEVWGQEISVNLKKGTNTVHLPFEIEQPQRWWPNGWGEPFQYEIPVKIIVNGKELDHKTVKIGLRTVALIQEEDSIGRSFYFKINGGPLFARGANYIPQSHFLPSVTATDYQRLIEDAKEANMNMIRVWGGGIYENDLFYELCDENGLLVWQDFMFAGSMYPSDTGFTDNVLAEVEDNVRRLRNHPSIIHWNGNNEIEVAWKNWGWQQQYGYTSEDSTRIWSDYLNLFHDRIPEVLTQLDDRSYTATSPLSNWGTPENFNYGSMHYWGVWHGQDRFEDFQYNVGRFMAEYGFQSFPDMETIAYFADSSDWYLGSAIMKHHQKSYVGNVMIEKQIANYFTSPADFPDFVIKSQQTQAKAMQIAIDAHRLKKGHCWGSLFWQLNDCWPGPSWSAIDVFGRKKLLYKELSTLFAPVAVIPHRDGEDLVITLINDTLEEVNGQLILTILDPEGQNEVIQLPVTCGKNGIKEVYRYATGSGKKGSVRLMVKDEVQFERHF